MTEECIYIILTNLKGRYGHSWEFFLEKDLKNTSVLYEK